MTRAGLETYSAFTGALLNRITPGPTSISAMRVLPRRRVILTAHQALHSSQAQSARFRTRQATGV